MFSALLGDMICLHLFPFLFCFTIFNIIVIMLILIVRFSHSVMTPKKTIDNRVTKVCGQECVPIRYFVIQVSGRQFKDLYFNSNFLRVS